MEPKVICIYHSRDLDGWMSGAIVKDRYPMAELIGFDYGDPVPKRILEIEDLDDTACAIFICDTVLPFEHMKLLNEKHTLVWLDHHKTAIKEMKPLKLKGIQNTKYAGCELTWQYIHPGEETPIGVELLGEYDSFRHKGTPREAMVNHFQYAARAHFSSPDECREALLDPERYHEAHELIEQGKVILKYLKREAENSMSRLGFDVELEGHKFRFLNAERLNPKSLGIDLNGYDGSGCFWYRNGQWEFSLYTEKEDLDVSEIAVKYGGGGHKGAAGFRSKNLNVIEC